MNILTEYSRTDSLSYRVVTHDRKGREGKGIGGEWGSRSLRIPNSRSARGARDHTHPSPMPTAAAGVRL